MSDAALTTVLLLMPPMRRTEVREELQDFAQILEADSVPRAREVLRGNKAEIAIVHRDVGEDALLYCSELDQTAGIRVIVVGTADDAAQMREAMQAGARDYVGEPLRPEELRAAVSRLSRGDNRVRRGRIATIYSPKGGVGKSMLAVNLGVALADRYKQKVAIVDLDLEFGSIATLYGMKPSFTIVEICRRSSPINLSAVQEVMARVPGAGDLEILAAPPTPDLAAVVDGEGKRSPERNYVQEILRALRTGYDWVIVDTASDFGEAVITALDEAQRILFMATPDVPALQNAAKGMDILLERLGYPPEKIEVVLNRSNAGVGLTEVEIGHALDHPIRHFLPSEGDIAVRAANTGVPLMRKRGRSGLARAIAQVAQSLTEPAPRTRIARLAEAK